MRIVPAVLGIALVAVGGAAIHLWREVGAGRRHIADLEAQLQEREAAYSSVTSAPAGPLSLPTAAAMRSTAALAAAPETSPAAKPAPSIPLPDIALLSAQMASPEATARRRQIGRSLIEGSYPYVSEALGLGPDEAGKLIDLLADHQESMSSVFPINLADSAPVSPQERAASARERQQTHDAQLQAMLGDRYSQWQDYRETLPVWQQSRDAASQGRPFAEVMTRHTPERRQRLLDVAAAHLSPQQLEGYRGMLERAAAQEQTILAPMRALQSGAASAPC